MGGAARQAARTRGASRERQGGLAGAATKNHGVYDRCGELDVGYKSKSCVNATLLFLRATRCRLALLAKPRDSLTGTAP